MTFTNTLETNKPTGDQSPTLLDEMIRTGTKAAIVERLAVDHDMTEASNTLNGDTVGKHKKISFVETTKPTAVANTAHLYCKEVAGQTEMFWEREDGSTEKQLTVSGHLNIEAADIPDDRITKAMINADVAGDGLIQYGDGSLNANVDDVTIEVSTDVLRLKAAGITGAKIAADTVAAANMLLPAKGASASFIGIPVMASGSYNGTDPTPIVITAFPTGTKIRHIVIRKLGAGASSNGVEAIAYGSLASPSVAVWNQADYTMYESGQVTVSGNTFTVNDNDDVNKSGVDYVWFALGVWKGSES
jgi:hypothetical protein